MKFIRVFLSCLFVLLTGCSEIQGLAKPPQNHATHAYCIQQQISCNVAYDPSWINAFR